MTSLFGAAVSKHVTPRRIHDTAPMCHGSVILDLLDQDFAVSISSSRPISKELETPKTSHPAYPCISVIFTLNRIAAVVQPAIGDVLWVIGRSISFTNDAVFSSFPRGRCRQSRLKDR